jgi:hypothetical protein
MRLATTGEEEKKSRVFNQERKLVGQPIRIKNYNVLYAFTKKRMRFAPEGCT